MGTNVRAMISEKNKYWVSKHRYYELKHFCLQYPTWKDQLKAVVELPGKPWEIIAIKNGITSDLTAKCAIARQRLEERMCIVEESAYEADPELADYILKAVTEGYSYDYLQAKLGIPCSKDTYYRRYRKFFWILSGKRD